MPMRGVVQTAVRTSNRVTMNGSLRAAESKLRTFPKLSVSAFQALRSHDPTLNWPQTQLGTSSRWR